jgi:hypothetical protein
MASLKRSQKAYLLIFILMFAVPTVSFGAFFDLRQDKILETGELKIDVYVTTSQKEPFNSAAGVILFDKQKFNINTFSVSESIFNLWKDEPQVSESGEIIFSGGTSAKGGFIFEGKLFSFLAKPAQFGDSNFYFENEKVLASDGIGTDIFEYSNTLSYRHTEAIPSYFDTDENGVVSIKELSIGLSTDA